MGWLQDKIKAVVKEEVKEELYQAKSDNRHHVCYGCGLVYDRDPDHKFYFTTVLSDRSYEWMFCQPCREKYKPKDTLLEWAKANRPKVQALKDKVERKGK